MNTMNIRALQTRPRRSDALLAAAVLGVLSATPFLVTPAHAGTVEVSYAAETDIPAVSQAFAAVESADRLVDQAAKASRDATVMTRYAAQALVERLVERERELAAAKAEIVRLNEQAAKAAPIVLAPAMSATVTAPVEMAVPAVVAAPPAPTVVPDQGSVIVDAVDVTPIAIPAATAISAAVVPPSPDLPPAATAPSDAGATRTLFPRVRPYLAEHVVPVADKVVAKPRSFINRFVKLFSLSSAL